ncbi:MAG: hypothetical protein H5U03_02165, partial [Clostridia bacterium]|nr:hypothetical protein [Clostridia bacterium]
MRKHQRVRRRMTIKVLRQLSSTHLALASLILLCCAVGNLGLQGCRHSPTTVETMSFQEAREVYDALLEATSFGDALLYNDNLTGRIVWNEAQFMESLVNMYELTKDSRYLELFIKHADHVLRMRDDRAGRADYAGRLRPGWQTGGHYTLGVPVIIPDEQGELALEVQGIHRSGNDHTVIEIVWEGGGRFTLIVRNDFRRAKPLEVRFEGLTMETAEAVVNRDLSPDSWIRIRVLANSLPLQGNYALTETYRMVLHELHTPIIGIPFLRFADLVFREPALSAYQSLAQDYVKAFEESFRDYQNSWREDAAGGYFVFEPNGKFWASGLPVPYNGLSANGRFLLWLWRVTGNADYLEKAAALARKVRAGITFLSDGTMTMPYWVKGSLHYTGWEGMSADPVNGLYTRCEPDPATEDVSHFSL